jgi:hypothetical protein
VRKGQGLTGANCSRATVCGRMCRWVALEEISVSVEPATHNLIVDIQARSVSPAIYGEKSGRPMALEGTLASAKPVHKTSPVSRCVVKMCIVGQQ